MSEYWIDIEEPYGTKSIGPIKTAGFWESTDRLDRAGEFVFEMPASDSRVDLFKALDKRYYARCYSIVGGVKTEEGAGIIDSVTYKKSSNSLVVAGTDLFLELADLSVNNLEILATSTRLPDSVQYYDGTATAYLNMAGAYDGNAATSARIPADDEDYLYIGDGAVFDIMTFDLGGYLNTDSNNFRLSYPSPTWATGTLVSDTTKVENCSFGQDGAIQWERPQAWATSTVNSVASKYWLRFRYGEDMSGDVTINEITVTQELPTSTALSDILAYASAWSLDSNYHDAVETDVYRKFADESVLTALIEVAERTGEHFRRGAGRTIEWLQDDQTAASVRAVSSIDAVGAQDNTLICLITRFEEVKDLREIVTRIYPYGAGIAGARTTLVETTHTSAGDYVVHPTENYIQSTAGVAAYGQVQRTVTWGEIGAINATGTVDTNASDALYSAAIEYLERHKTKNRYYKLQVTKLDADLKVGQVLPVQYKHYEAGFELVDVDENLWVLEKTTRLNANGTRVVSLLVSTIDAWPETPDDATATGIQGVRQLRSYGGPMNATGLTKASATALLADLDLSAYLKRATDETVTGRWEFVDPLRPGVLSLEGPPDEWVYSGLYLKDNTTKDWGIKHHFKAPHLNDLEFSYSDDSGASWVSPMWLTPTGDLTLLNDLILANAAVIGIAGNEIITFQAAGTIDFTGADVTMDNDLTVTNDILLSDGSVIGITGNEVITFQAAGTIDFTGADVTMDNDLTVTNDILLSDGSVIGITGNEAITFQAAGTIDFTGADVTMDGDLTVTGAINVIHTAIEADDHAVELAVDAAGYGDVKALEIAYVTGAISAGEDEGIILININEIAALGGDIFGLEILATDGGASVYGLKAGVLVGPVHQDSGTFANPTKGTDNTIGSSVTDTSIGFTQSPDTITDSNNGFGGFVVDELVVVTGATTGANNTTYTITAVAAGALTVTPQPNTVEDDGATITVEGNVPAMFDGSSGTTTAIFETNSEYILIGAAAAFEEIEFILTTPSSNPGIKPTFWYSSAAGGGFTQFTPVDGTNGFRNTGVVAWDASDLVGHIVGGVTGTFDIKIIRTKTGSLSQDPILGYAKVAATTEYIWDKSANVSIATLRTTQTAGETLLLQAYDVDGATYTTFATLTANNTPTWVFDQDISFSGDILLADGAVIGIAGNEVITFDAAGTIAITGADVLLGSEDGLGKLNFDEGTAIADGIVWGSDANKVTLYRSADDILKTDDSLTVAVGLNGGAGTGAAAGQAIFKDAAAFVKVQSAADNVDISGFHLVEDGGGSIGQLWFDFSDTAVKLTLAVNRHIMLDVSGTGKVGVARVPAYMLDVNGQLRVGAGIGVVPTLIATTVAIFQENDAVGDNARVMILGGAEGGSLLQFADAADADVGALYYNHDDDFLAFYANALEAGRIDAAQDWYKRDDGANWSQVSDEQLKTDIAPITNVMASLRLLNPIRFRFNEQYHEIWPDSNISRIRAGFTAQNFGQVFPEQISSVGKYKSMNTSGLSALLVAGVQELDGHRLTADAEREAIRARLDSIERRE